MRHIRLPALLAALACTGGVATPVQAAELEGVGNDLGYRFFGEPRKNKPVLVQNSRAQSIEIFDAGRGLFMPVPSYTDAELECRGTERTLRVRYKDRFRESVPFQVNVRCGQELQFIEPVKLAAPRPTPPARQEIPEDGARDGEATSPPPAEAKGE